MATPVHSPKDSARPAHVELPETKADQPPAKKLVRFAQGVKVMDTAEVERHHEAKRATKGRSKDTMESASGSGCCLDPVFSCCKSTYETVKPYVESAIEFCTPYVKKVGEFFSWGFNSLWALAFGAKAAEIKPEAESETVNDSDNEEGEEGDAVELENTKMPPAPTSDASAKAAAAPEATDDPFALTPDDLRKQHEEIQKFRTKYFNPKQPASMDNVGKDLDAMILNGPKIRNAVSMSHKAEIAAIKAQNKQLAEDASISADWAAMDLFLKSKPEVLRLIVIQLESQAGVALTRAQQAEPKPRAVAAAAAPTSAEGKEREATNASPPNGEFEVIKADDARAPAEAEVSS